MQVFLNVEINIFAAVILFLIYLNIRNKTNTYLIEQKLFMTMIIFNTMILIFDSFTWILDGMEGFMIKPFLILSAVLYYILHPIICMNWSLYVDYQINRNNSRIKKLFLPMMIPVVINFVFSILSAFGNYYFYIDSNNVYHRGKFFILIPILSFIFVAFTALYILLNRKRIHKPFFLSFIIFAVPPLIGSLIQFAFYGTVLIWICMTISILIVFINIQNEQMYLDYLTGLFNRRQLDLYLQEIIQKNKVKFAGIMIDINSFKYINDQYGHSAGDEALKFTSVLLKKIFRHNSFISRFGGDEFVVILNVDSKLTLDRIINELKEDLRQFNSTNTFSYQINLSIGATIYDHNYNMNGQEFLDYIDTLMYQDKPYYKKLEVVQ